MDQLFLSDSKVSFPQIQNLSSVNLTQLATLLNQLNPEQLEELYNRLDILHPEEPGFKNIPPYEQDLTPYVEYKIYKTIWMYFPPILIVLGTFGNIFSFFILKRKAMLKFSTYFYLMVLAIADTLVLFIGLLPLWIGELTGFKLIHTADWICKATNAIGYTVSDFSVWLIIAVTTERYIVVCHPLKASTMCNTPRARNVIIGLLAGFFLLNIHFLWTVEIIKYKYGVQQGVECRATKSHEVFMETIWPWCDAFLYSFLPFLIIVVLNSLIIRQVILARRSRAVLAELATGDYEQRRPSHEGSTRLTVMLLTISFAFLLTTLPMNIVNITGNFIQKQSSEPISTRTLARFKLARTITQMLMYCNHSINFFLYCATGQKFRHQLVWMVCYAKRTYSFSWVSEAPSQNGTRLETIKHTGPFPVRLGKKSPEVAEEQQQFMRKGIQKVEENSSASEKLYT